MDLKLVPLEIPEGGNVILGQSHFIKTVDYRNLLSFRRKSILHSAP